MSKINKNQYYMDIANLVSTRSSCLTRKVGAILVKDDHIISTGYNGTPRGMLNCDDGGCKRCRNHFDLEWEMGYHYTDDEVKNYEAYSGADLDKCFCLHAEENTIVQCAKQGISTDKAVLYTIFLPCIQCVKLIINAGIPIIYWQDPYGNTQETVKFIEFAGIRQLQIPRKVEHYE